LVTALSSKRRKVPFRVKMADGSIETIYAYSEAQALFFASKAGKKPIKVVGILGEERAEEKAKEEIKAVGEELLGKLLEELERALKEKRYLDAIRWQIEIHKAIAEGRIAWSNKLETKYGMFKYI